tara:strand:- start:173 stop:430 length:258 start_codon:yes stop_codon:yes gene_type:complete
MLSVDPNASLAHDLLDALHGKVSRGLHEQPDWTEPWHCPLVQMSFSVHGSPSKHPPPSFTGCIEHWPEVGLHVLAMQSVFMLESH